jgi:hypothetical protein
MITLKEYMELVEYRITEGGDYGWQCYGNHAHHLSAWNGIHDVGGWSANAVFDTKTQIVYEVEICDYTHNRAYRLINPEFKSAHSAESTNRGINSNEAWDDVDYVDLDVVDDFIQKALAIRNGEDYDTRVQIEVDFSDEELLKYMKFAHERDMTFNQFVEEALRYVLDEVNTGRLTKEHAQTFVSQHQVDFWPFDKAVSK